MDNSSKNTGLFRHEEKKAIKQDSLGDVSKDLLRRLRILEEKHSSIRRILQMNEQNMLKEHREFSKELRAISEDLSQLKKRIHDFGDELKLIVSDLKECVKKEDIKELESYINIINPLGFVSYKEVEGIVKKELKKAVESLKYSEMKKQEDERQISGRDDFYSNTNNKNSYSKGSYERDSSEEPEDYSEESNSQNKDKSFQNKDSGFSAEANSSDRTNKGYEDGNKEKSSEEKETGISEKELDEFLKQAYGS